MRIEPANSPQINQETPWQKDAKLSSFAIAMISFFFVGAGLLGYGVSTTQAVVMTGFSFMYQLAALHFILIGLALFVIATLTRLGSFYACGQKAL